MSITDGLLSGWSLWLSLIIYLAALAMAAWRAPWGVLFSNRALQHLFFGATVVLMLMWTMRAGISPGLAIHFLGVTALTLVFGWDLAILAATLALLGMALIGIESWDGLALNGVCSVLLPVLVTSLLLKQVEARLPKNFFIYLFICGFAGAGISAAVAGSSTVAVLWLEGVYDWARIHREYVMYLPLIMFPEGLLNGILLTGIMVFYPDWIRTFNAREYIDDQ
ncbi:energy-coupling factor ABC transporter permease [Marinobacterium jannaschii]|uniref:energy-coupling factor ABC transporter permease n=1 Tax=Marinobacterium jannaschii TaxID=64970 RepID=UPI000480B678|nr:energy-coupling factor ABC transporter permease [Marinobacterium jannaschii]